MVLPIPSLIKTPRTPFTKPAPGTPINWRHPFARHLVHSYPFNEGKGTQIKNYCWPSGEYDLKFRAPNVADSPVWGIYANVPGLALDIDQGNPLDHMRGNTGITNPDTTGANLLPCIDFSKGFTIHLWQRPTQSLVGVVTSYVMFAIGNISAATRQVVWIFLSRFASSGTDWWRRNIQVYSNGVAGTLLTNSLETWEAPYDGTFVHIDSLPYEHVISVNASPAFGDVWWYASDGRAYNFASIGAITPPDGNQYWPEFHDAGGIGPFEGNVWGWNVYNRPMGFYSAMALMGNPLQMYAPEPSNGQVFSIAAPPPDTGGSDPGGGDDGGGLTGEVALCDAIEEEENPTPEPEPEPEPEPSGASRVWTGSVANYLASASRGLFPSALGTCVAWITPLSLGANHVIFGNSYDAGYGWRISAANRLEVFWSNGPISTDPYFNTLSKPLLVADGAALNYLAIGQPVFVAFVINQSSAPPELEFFAGLTPATVVSLGTSSGGMAMVNNGVQRPNIGVNMNGLTPEQAFHGSIQRVGNWHASGGNLSLAELRELAVCGTTPPHHDQINFFYEITGANPEPDSSLAADNAAVVGALAVGPPICGV